MSTTSDQDGKETYLDDEYIKYVPPDDDTVCNICMAEFIEPDDLELHLHQVHNVYRSKMKSCQFCSQSYTDFMAYAVHIRDAHITSLKRCKYCLKAFIDIENCIEHERKHKRGSNKRIYYCSQCSETFTSVYLMKNHEQKRHDNNHDGIILNKYLPYLSAALNIKASTFLQYLDSNTVYICVGCDFTANDVELYIEHAQKGNCVTYVCNKCSNTYKKKGYMSKHLSKECGPQKMAKVMRKCPECGGYFHRQEYKTHKKMCNTIKCYICEITFENMYQLSAHQSKQHPLSVEVKSCKFCGKQSVGTVALQKHIDRSHKGELHMYKYVCVYCNKAYKHPQKLFGHFYTKHKDINPYTCKICNMEFRPRKKFTIHIKLQHDSKGFVEFDKNYHVYFTETKSDDPFIPKSIYTAEDGELEKTDNTDKAGKSDNNIKLVDCTSVTETEGNQTEIETKKIKKKCVRPKRPVKVQKVKKVVNNEPICVQSSDDEPLLVVKKRTQPRLLAPLSRNMLKKQQQTENNKKQFTCKICRKYCYTYQNYNHHMSLHSKNDAKKCIICKKTFKSKQKLAVHVSEKHSSSKLTDTLKHMIEKRKSGITVAATEVSMSEKFKKTIKKVELRDSMVRAKIKPLEDGLSVQTFIENFTPEEIKNDINITSDVTVKVVSGLYKKPTIKLTKFNPKPLTLFSRLSMPVKFKDGNTEKTNVTMKIVQQPITYDYIETDTNNDDDFDRNEIPEVAEEVMLEGTEEPAKPLLVPHKIVIDKLPKDYPDIRIAHLLPQAPYYKIIKVKDVLEPKEEKKYACTNGDTIKLPDGTKFVSSNPLAHLLGNTPVEKVLEPIKNKYYNPRVKNFEGILAKALAKLDKPTPPRKKKVNAVERVKRTVVDKKVAITGTAVANTATEVENTATEVEYTATEIENTATEVEYTATEIENTVTEIPITATEVNEVGVSLPMITE